MEKRSSSKLALIFLTIVMLCGMLQVNCQPCSALSEAFAEASQSPSGEDASEGNFSIVWITDTQYLTESYPTYFDSLCRWIVNNANKYNVKMVIHTGDIVEDEGNRTHWENANKSMSILSNAGIPYCWNAGNHDYNASCWIGNQYAAFNPANPVQEAYWINDYADGKSTAVHFGASDLDFLVVNLGYNADNATLDWANNLIDAYPESRAIVATHFYLNRTGGYEAWATNLKWSVLASHQNVFLTLSAHVYPLAYSGLRTQVGDRHELVFNRQDKDNFLGAASLRILTFNTVEGAIDVKTFVIYANTLLTDENNQFTLNTSFWNDAAVTEIQEIPEFPSETVLVFLPLLAITLLVFRAHRKR